MNQPRFLPLIAFVTVGVALLALLPAISAAEESEAPSTHEQALSLQEMCSANADAMAERQTKQSLYDRLGGREKIHDIVVEIVRLHGINSQIKHLVEHINTKRLVANVTDFLVVGTGGPGEYKGLNMFDAHEHLKLTNADFLAAGSDVMKAMKSKGCEEAEIQEVVCALVALRDQVVIESERELR